jgi:hypothetical protein
MVYAADSKSAAFTGLRVQVSSPALSEILVESTLEIRTSDPTAAFEAAKANPPLVCLVPVW